MAKIHTHYDNLKVARLAPPEVIRAAYKALSQKYHPDKNPGDEKAARIMAILNSAYGTLSDPLRRKEHDEWIAAEEWEIDWLESTREESRDKQRADPGHGWEPREVEPAEPYRAARDPKWWFGLAGAFACGCVLGLYIMEQPRVLPVALASALQAGSGARAGAAQLETGGLRADPGLDSWALGAAAEGGQQAPDIKALAITELIVPARAPDCDTELHTLAAPNGESWPVQSGYVEGFPVGNRGDEMQILVDNGANSSAVFVKVYDLDRRSNVRHAYVLAHGSLAIDKLAAGKYEVRYQNVEVGGSRAECAARRKRAIRQAAAGTPN
jgi:curved DNA-binding protein CbpA